MESRSVASSAFAAACVAAASVAHALPPSDQGSLFLLDGGNAGMPGATDVVSGEAKALFRHRADRKIQVP